MSTRITDLPQAETLNGSEVMPLVQNGVTKHATLDFINQAAPAALILQQTQQAYANTVVLRDETEALKTEFEAQYLGSFPAPPVLNNDGSTLTVGAIYWNTSISSMYVWNGAEWTAFSSPSMRVHAQRFSGDGIQTDFLMTLGVSSASLVDVFINGIYQNKNTFTVEDTLISFSEPPPSGTENVEVLVAVATAIGETDASLVSYKVTDDSETVRTVQSKLREWVSVKDFGAVGDGVADDTEAIQAALDSFAIVGSTSDTPPIPYRQGVVFVPIGKYLITSQVNIPVGVSIIGQAQATNYNVAGLPDTSFGSVFWVTATGKLKISGKQLRGSAASIEYIKFTHGQTLRQAGPYSGACFEVDGAFVLNFRFCDFIELGFETALKAVNSNGVRVQGCNFIKIGNPNSQQPMPPASGYTYGTAIDFTTCYDSFITDTFIEACGNYGAIISTNTKVIGCFIDLCKVGVRSIGARNQIIGSSIKWNQADGIQLVSSDGAMISGNEIVGNNYASSTISASIGFAIRFDATSSKYVTIVGNNMVDDYTGSYHASYKTVAQAGINLGAGASTTAIIANNWFTDTDAQWDATLKAKNPVLDSVGRIATGHVRTSMNMLQSSGPASERSMPYTTAAASTLGSVTRRIAYRDQDGTVLGQIPLYNSIT